MLRRVAARVMTAVLVAGALQVAAPTAYAALGTPTLSPTNGASVSGSDLVVSAAYGDLVGSTLAQARLSVVDSTHTKQYPCQDEVFLLSGSTTVRCHVRDLVSASYHAVATIRSVTGTVLSQDAWDFTVSTPTVTTSWPTASQVVAGSVSDPAPGPGTPITLTYDQALSSTSTALLFATSSGVRTSVAATTSVSGSTLSVEPSQALTAGEYVVTSDAVGDPSGAHTSGALSFVVGDPVTMPIAPRQGGTLDPTSPESVVIAITPGAGVPGLVVYDPASPATYQRTEVASTVICPGLSGGACVRMLLPVSGLPAGDYHWYADTRVGTLTVSTPDRPLTLGASAPTAATNLTATAPLSPSDSPYVHVTGTVDSATSAVLVTAARGVTTSRTVVAASNGPFDAWVKANTLQDGDLSVSVVPYDAAGRAGPSAPLVVPKESVDLAVAGPQPTIGPSNPVTVTFDELVRNDSSLALRTAQGAPVGGQNVSYTSATNQLAFYPSAPLTTQTYQVDVTAYAASCPVGQTTTCEKVVTTVSQPVDATPPAAPTSVVVTPRAMGTGQHSVEVTGTADSTAGVVVHVGTISADTTRGAEANGLSSFDTGLVDVSSLPRALVPVSVVSTDTLGNARTTPEGYVERRWASVIRSGVTPTTIPWGTTTTVSGRLTDATTGAGRGSATVLLEQRHDDGSVSRVGTTRTASDGRFVQPVVLTRSGSLRARFAGASSTRPTAAAWSTRVVVGARGATPADHPDTLAVARTRAASPQGALLSETLRSSADVDWYGFGVQTAGYHLIRLGHLAGNGTLALYDRAGHRLAGSDRSGSSFEELYRYLPAGTYFVRVGGSGSATPYHLRFWRVPDQVTLLSHRYDSTFDELTIDVLNNTGQWRELGMPLSCVSAKGAVTRQQDWVGLPLAPPHSRRPFSVTIEPCPTGYTMRVGISSEVSSRRALAASYSMRRAGMTTDRFDRRYLVDVTNHGSSTLRNLTVFVEEYDAEGVLTGFGSVVAGPVAPGASRRVEADTWRKSTAVNCVLLLGATLV